MNVSTNPLLPSYSPADSSPEGVLSDDNIPLQSNGSYHATFTDSICYPISEATRPDATETATQIERAIHMKDNAGTEGPPRKKRGRPRKDGGNPMESQEEVCGFDNPGGKESDDDLTFQKRRRKQIRLAQRAYRQREKGVVSHQQSRITDLETVIEKMSVTINSLGANLKQSDVLIPHAELRKQLSDCLASCRSLVFGAGLPVHGHSITPPSDYHEPAVHDATQDPSSLPAMSVDDNPRPLSPLPSPFTIFRDKAPSSPIDHDPSHFLDQINDASHSGLDLSQFIQQLRLACVYHAVVSLRDPGVTLENLRRKFRFLLSLLSREDLLSYFEDCLAAKRHPERMVKWDELPFFGVGGAGKHFVSSPSPKYQSLHAIWETSSCDHTSDNEDLLDGDWYDSTDLERLLDIRGIRLFIEAPTVNEPTSPRLRAINASAFLDSKPTSFDVLNRF